MTTSIATLTQNQILRARILEVQTAMSRAQVQVATGKKTDVFSGLRSDARTSISLNNTKATIDAYKQTIALTKARMDTMQAAFKRLGDIAVEIRTTVLQIAGVAPTATGSASATLKSLAQNRLKEIASILNTEVDGRHLFSGFNLDATPMIDVGAIGSAGTPLDTVATGAPALGATATTGDARYNRIAGATDSATAAALAGATTINVAGPAAGVQAGMQVKFAGHSTLYTITAVAAGQITVAGPGLTAGVANGESLNYVGYIDSLQPSLYYQGDTTTGAQVSARIDDGFDLAYGVRGDDPSIATILGAIYAVATSDLTIANEAGYRQMSTRALADLQTGFDELQQVIGVLGVQQTTLDQTDKRHTDFQIMLAEQITNIEDVDAADAITRMQLLQNNLEASYRLIANTRELTLVRFL
jgi:flagellar hook-associated protein 3 FlgL